MKELIQLALKLLTDVSSLINRETAAEEKLKDLSVQDVRKMQRAIFRARQIFDGNKKFRGTDEIAREVLNEDEYKEYQRLRKYFNKNS